MIWYNFLHENTTFTNKWDAELFGKGKAWVAGRGKERVVPIKSLIYPIIEKMHLGVRYERSIRIDWICELIIMC
jgi:hypothetical protein